MKNKKDSNSSWTYEVGFPEKNQKQSMLMSKQKSKKERIDKYRPPTDSFNDLVENSI